MLSVGSLTLSATELMRFKRGSVLDLPRHKVLGRKPRIEDTGIGTAVIAITAKFAARFGPPEDRRRAWQAAQTARDVLAVSWQSGDSEGDFYVQSLDFEIRKADAQGRPILLVMEAELAEWPGDPGVEAAAPAGRLTSRPATGAPAPLDPVAALRGSA